MSLEGLTRDRIDRALLMCMVVDDLEKAGKIPHFNAVVEAMEKDCARNTVSRAHDILEVEGWATAEWAQRDDGKHVRRIILTPLGKAAAEKVRSLLGDWRKLSVEPFGGHPNGPMLYGCTTCGQVYIYGPKAEACCKKGVV